MSVAELTQLIEERNARTAAVDYGRLNDPFRCEKPSRAVVATRPRSAPALSRPAEPLPILRLDGITCSRGKARAVIDGALYTIGSEAGEFRIIDVGRKEIVVALGMKRWSVKPGESIRAGAEKTDKP